MLAERAAAAECLERRLLHSCKILQLFRILAERSNCDVSVINIHCTHPGMSPNCFTATHLLIYLVVRRSLRTDAVTASWERVGIQQ